jgi:hypothetical protein
VELDRRKVVAARTIAVIADAVQIGLFPLFMEGALSTANDVLDVVVAGVLTALVGWHWSFLPAFVSELVPFLDLVPSWTAAVFLATRHSGPAMPPSPQPPPPQQPQLQPGPKPPPAP